MPQNFENPSSAAELLEKIMVIANVIGKSENLGTKIDKLELDSERGPFFRDHHDFGRKIRKKAIDSK